MKNKKEQLLCPWWSSQRPEVPRWMPDSVVHGHAGFKVRGFFPVWNPCPQTAADAGCKNSARGWNKNAAITVQKGWNRDWEAQNWGLRGWGAGRGLIPAWTVYAASWPPTWPVLFLQLPGASPHLPAPSPVTVRSVSTSPTLCLSPTFSEAPESSAADCFLFMVAVVAYLFLLRVTTFILLAQRARVQQACLSAEQGFTAEPCPAEQGFSRRVCQLSPQWGGWLSSPSVIALCPLVSFSV